MDKLIRWIQANPLAGLIVLIAGSVFFAIGATRLEIDTSITRLIDQQGPDATFYREVVSSFGTDRVTAIYLRDPQLFSPEKLQSLARLAANLESIDGLERIASLWNTPFLGRAKDGTQIDAGPLIPPGPITEASAREIQAYALGQSALHRTLISPDGLSTAIHLYFPPEFLDDRDPLKLYQDIERTLSPFEGKFEKLFQLGRPYQTYAQVTTLLEDARWVLPLSILLTLGLLVALLGTWHAALLPLLTSLVSILWTVGFMGFMGIPGTNVNFILPSLLLVLGSTEDIHILAGYREARRLGLPAQAAIEFMASRTGPALLLTAATTFLGVLSLSFNPLVIIAEFGLAAAFGLLVNPIITILIAPWYLERFDVKPPARPVRLEAKLGHLSEKLAGLAAGNGHRVLPLAALAFAGMALYSWGVGFENDPIQFFRRGNPLIQRVAEIREHLSGPDELVLHVDGTPGSLDQIDTWRRLDDFATFLDGLEWTGNTLSILDPIRTIDRVVRLDITAQPPPARVDIPQTPSQSLRPGKPPLPDNVRTLHEYLVLLESMRTADFLRLDEEVFLIRVRHALTSSRELLEEMDEIVSAASRILGAGFALRITGESLLVHRAVLRVVTAHWWSLLAAGGIIFLALSIWFRSLSLGTAALFANLFPLAATFCVMRLLDIPLDLATSMVGVIAIGVSVDHAIHLVSRFEKEQRGGLDRDQALRATLRAELLPILTSSIALASGFAFLSFSSFLPVARLGILGAAVMVSALIANLAIVPLWLGRRPTGAQHF